MAKLSKSTRTVIIAAAVLLALGVVCLVLMLTKGSDENDNSHSHDESETSQVEDNSLVFSNRQADEVVSAEVTNSYGEYTFSRDSRVVTTENDDGTVSSSDEYYWTSEQLCGAPSSDSTIRAFMNCLAGFDAYQLVEENAEDLAQYGLAQPEASVNVTFEDDEKLTLHLGIINPSATSYVYCRVGDSRDVYMASYYSASYAYLPITDFVVLSITESYNSNDPEELDYFIIERKDFDEPVEISYMYDLEEDSDDDDIVITTFNSHRITSPFVAEVDYTTGKEICYGLYGIYAEDCISVDPSEELLAEAGMDDPFCTLTFKYGGKRYVIKLGNEIVSVTKSEDGETPDLKTVTGYYGMVSGSNILYAFSADSTPWYTIKLEELVARRPVSSYIYTCESVVITTPEREYEFIIEGDASASTFTLDGVELDNDKFKQLYQHLVSSVGEELYRVEGDYEPYVSIQFNYREKYYENYGTDHDRLDFYKSDDRKNIVSVNGEVLFKVRQVFTDRLIENIDALINGGEIKLDW